MRFTSAISGGLISRERSFGGDAAAAGFIGTMPHFTA
jgi:hypothetical protein